MDPSDPDADPDWLKWIQILFGRHWMPMPIQIRKNDADASGSGSTTLKSFFFVLFYYSKTG
jgi:hypothetical protein